MERKLLEERFQLKTNIETREMSALMLTAVKGGVKMTPSILVDPGVTFGMSPAHGNSGFIFTAQNASMGDFNRALQGMLDRPVVDNTELKGQFDFNLTFMPDDTVFGGRAHLPQSESGEAAPDLYRPLQEELGLKLSRFKGQVDVLVVDHLQRSAAN